MSNNGHQRPPPRGYPAPPAQPAPYPATSPSVSSLMIPNDGPFGQASYGFLGPGPNTRGVPAWDALGPLSQSTPNNRGAIARIVAGQTISVADLRAVPNVVGRDLALVLGLTVEGLEEDFVTDEAVDSAVTACITWGLGSAEFRAEVDWIDGTVITIPAEQINIRATYERTFVGDTDPACPPAFCLAAGFAYGCRGKNSNPARLTKYVEILDTNGTQQIKIPNFATSFNVVLVTPSTTAQVDVFGFGAGLANRVVITAPSSNVSQYDVENAFPLRNGARFLKVTNTNQSGPLRAYVIFGLSL